LLKPCQKVCLKPCQEVWDGKGSSLSQSHT
jgi:hypothetical protein